MTKTEALQLLLREAAKNKITLAAYKRIIKACRVLEIPPEDHAKILISLEYRANENIPSQF